MNEIENFHFARDIIQDASQSIGESAGIVIYAFDRAAAPRTCTRIVEIPWAYYEFTNNLSREALQSIGAVCCRVTSARFCPIQKSKRPPFVPPYIRGRGVGDQIHPRVHYYSCIVLLNIDSIAFE